MKHVIIIAILLATGFMNSQTNYEKSMQKAFGLWGGNPTGASNLFERIANADRITCGDHCRCGDQRTVDGGSVRTAEVGHLDLVAQRFESGVSARDALVGQDQPVAVTTDDERGIDQHCQRPTVWCSQCDPDLVHRSSLPQSC